MREFESESLIPVPREWNEFYRRQSNVNKKEIDALSYDALSQIVNESYRITGNIRRTARETEVPLDFVWEMVGLKDHSDFGDTEKE